MNLCALSVVLSIAAFAAVLIGFATGLPGLPLVVVGFAAWARTQFKRC